MINTSNLDSKLALIIGQANAVATMQATVKAATLQEIALASFFVSGAMGSGKGHLCESMIADLESQGFSCLRITAENLRKDNGIISDLESFLSSGKCVIYFEECHEIAAIKNKLPQGIIKWVRRVLDQRYQGEPVEVCDEKCLPFDKNRHIILCDTRSPEKFPADIIDRMVRVTLQPYSEAEIDAILTYHLKSRRITVSETARSRIVKCARGSARPLVVIVNALHQIAQVAGKQTVNADDVTEALRITEQFPLGLRMNETQVLLLCEQGKRKAIELCAMLDCAASGLRERVGYLFAKGLLTNERGYYQLTKLGQAVIAAFRKDKLIK